MLAILIADSHAIVRRGLREILAEEFGSAEFGNAQNAAETLELVERRRWDLVVLDISMPDSSGLDVIRILKERQPRLPVLVLSMYPESQYAVRAIRAGAMGYVTNQSVAKELAKAVRTVLDGGKYISTSLTQKLMKDVQRGAMPQAPHENLSDREYQVLCAVAAGKTQRAIAEQLGLSVKTVVTYRGRVGEKLGLKTKADFVRYCREYGLGD